MICLHFLNYLGKFNKLFGCSSRSWTQFELHQTYDDH